MVIGAFPAAKLGALLLRQISKPIANSLISSAKSSPVFRKYICMPPAQFYNWCEVKTKMWILNLGKPVNIPVLNEQMAIELGANLIGEAFIFLIAAAILTNELARNARKEAQKEADKKEEMEALISQIQELSFQLEQQRVEIKELFRYIGHRDTPTAKKSGRKPSDNKPKDEPPSSSSSSSAQNVSNETSAVHSDGAKSNLLKDAISIVELEFLNNTNPHREDGVLTVAINHLYRNVYKLSLSMC